MLGLLSQPKVQSADTVILTLCDRISHSLLLEDRKAAVLALRGLSHESRELVASAGLRGLLEVLIKDSHDAESARVTLETLLILFNTETRRKVRNKHYVSPLLRRNQTEAETEIVANDISLWLADELLHNEEALKVVFDLAATKNDPFTAVYALQLISAIAANRPSEAKQITMSNGGVATIVAALESVQDMVREEAMLLLTVITADHLDLQKLVAFEGGFDKLFGLLNDGGGVVYGGKTAEKSLELLANLLEYNTSNQKLFTQSNYVNQWVDLLHQISDAEEEGVPWREQSVANVEAALQIGQLLAVPGAERTQENQNVLAEAGALTATLKIAFGPNSPPQIRVAALLNTSALIDSNEARQADLLAMDVPYYDLTIMKAGLVEPRTIPLAQVLLNWTLTLSSTYLFDLRAAAFICLSASFRNNEEAKAGFLKEQIDSYGKSDFSEDVNLIEVLAEYSDDTRLNPFRVWFASALVMRLFVNSNQSKDQLRAVKVGDESLGMEVHSLIQAISGEMQNSLTSEDSTAALGYMQLLATWMFDDSNAVNEFLSESSAAQALLGYQNMDPLVESLSVIVLGTAYAFSTKDSPLTRTDFHKLLTKSLGRDHYLLLVRKFRQSPIFQNFDESDLFGAPKGPNGMPAVYLEAPFIELMRENLNFISRAVDMEPDVEPSSRISFEMFDEIKTELHNKTQAFLKTEGKLEDAKVEIKRLKAEVKEVSRAGAESESKAKENKEKLETLEKNLKELQTSLEETKKTLATTTGELTTTSEKLHEIEAKYTKKTTELETITAAKTKAEDGINNLTRELFQLKRSNDSSQKDAKKFKDERDRQEAELEGLRKGEKELKQKLQAAEKESKANGQSLKQLKEVNDKLVTKLKETAATIDELKAEDEELKTKLKAAKSEAESSSHELRSVQNREAAARKEVDLAKARIADYKKSSQNSQQVLEELEHLKAKITTLEAESKAGKRKLEAAEKAKEETKKDHEATKAELSAARDTSSTVQKEKSTMAKELAVLKETNSKLLAAVKDSKQKHLSEVSGLKEEIDTKQSALDELMVLLDELTNQKSAYKTRLRALEQEVSESEEDEDEEDEDDEGDKPKSDS